MTSDIEHAFICEIRHIPIRPRHTACFIYLSSEALGRSARRAVRNLLDGKGRKDRIRAAIGNAANALTEVFGFDQNSLADGSVFIMKGTLLKEGPRLQG